MTVSARAWGVLANATIDLRTVKPTKAEAQSEWLSVEKDLHVNYRHTERLDQVWNALKGDVEVVPVRVEVET